MTSPRPDDHAPTTGHTRRDWTGGPAKWLAVVGLGLLCVVGVVRSVGRVEPGPDHAIEGAAHLVDLNSATADELAMLPRIGPTRAAAIVADRDRRGPFSSPDDLRRVRGIGPRTVEGLRPFATARPPDPVPGIGD